MVTRLLWEQESQFKSDIFDHYQLMLVHNYTLACYSYLFQKRKQQDFVR